MSVHTQVVTAATESVRVEGTGQTIDYIEHVTWTQGATPHTLRIRIHDDSHADQAFGIVERWDGARWCEVASIRGDALELKHGLGYQTNRMTRDAIVRAFTEDRDNLLALAIQVVRDRTVAS